MSAGGSFAGNKSWTDTDEYKTQTSDEAELSKMDLDLRKASQDQMIDVNQAGLNLSKQMLTGGDLPGNLANLPGGINEDVTQNLVNKSLKDVATSAQYSGILDSGVTGEIGTKAAADVRTQSEQFNLQNLLQLLNLALGSSAQVQQPVMGFGQMLSSRLQGLRSTTTGTDYHGIGGKTYGEFSTGGGTGGGGTE